MRQRDMERGERGEESREGYGEKRRKSWRRGMWRETWGGEREEIYRQMEKKGKKEVIEKEGGEMKRVAGRDGEGDRERREGK